MRPWTHPTTTWAGAALAVVLAVAATACGTGGTGATQQHGQPSGSTAATAPASSAGTTPAAPPRCGTAQLEVWLGIGPGGAAAGGTYTPLELTDVSRHACRLYGYPGVSAWDGHRDGRPARRTGGAEHAVTLAPGATAHAVLRITDVGSFPPGRCRPVTAAALRVYPPGERTSTEIPFTFAACGRAGPAFLSIAPIRPGVGIPGHPGP